MPRHAGVATGGVTWASLQVNARAWLSDAQARLFWIEATSNGLRAYFMPEDEKSTLYIYEAEVK